MNTTCHAVRMELTELLMLERPLPTPLARHLAGCDACADEAEGVRRVIRTFERAESPLTIRDDAHPARLARTPLGRAVRTKPSYARGRRRAALVTAAVALACCVAVTVTADGDRSAPAATRVTLSREGRMVERGWGTEVPVSLSGLRPGQTYRLMTADADGRRMPAGSLRADEGGSSLHTRMMTAMPRRRISVLLVQDEHGRLVASVKVTPPPATGEA
ncbi:hypothetical protein QQY24_00620 [Streptomyces sp. TG1A-8]|uniref:hypothetical protein n=1 Tax=Streptomyces sp. TG1A-8 TaxID=3051385 RepID=UPI00265C38C8|nr:hypothetical protein [Streptomyces sp. TG1A-8]MDO0924021.1 hypothetical protein [Streptomyces sp. TG1A-8]